MKEQKQPFAGVLKERYPEKLCKIRKSTTSVEYSFWCKPKFAISLRKKCIKRIFCKYYKIFQGNLLKIISRRGLLKGPTTLSVFWYQSTKLTYGRFVKIYWMILLQQVVRYRKTKTKINLVAQINWLFAWQQNQAQVYRIMVIQFAIFYISCDRTIWFFFSCNSISWTNNQKI